MESFHWNEYFETGLSEVDSQHHRIVDIINEFSDHLTKNELALGDIEVIFKELAKYADYHFREEEGLMYSIGIDQRHVDNHVKAHKDFLIQVTLMHSEISLNNLKAAKNLFDFLTHWLAYHILGCDQNMARQIKAIQSGLNPTEAYKLEEHQENNATEPLLIALDSLFKQVSARNRELIRLNKSLEIKVAERTKALAEANHHLEALTRTDVLTGLPNRRHGMKCLADLWAKSTETTIPLVCMMIDADHFKEVNDTYGHDAGDLVLCELAKTLQHTFRNDDIVCRLGGDEFLVICPNTDLSDGMLIAQRVLNTVSKIRVPIANPIWHGSISMGVAVRTPEIKSFEDLIKFADQGVYLAKQDGRNCIRSVFLPLVNVG